MSSYRFRELQQSEVLLGLQTFGGNLGGGRGQSKPLKSEFWAIRTLQSWPDLMSDKLQFVAIVVPFELSIESNKRQTEVCRTLKKFFSATPINKVAKCWYRTILFSNCGRGFIVFRIRGKCQRPLETLLERLSHFVVH
jgi:hypothetical protein